MHIDLDFVLIVLKSSKHCKGVTNANVVCAEPATNFGLTLAWWTTGISIIVKPQDAGHHSSRIINYHAQKVSQSNLILTAEEVLVIFLHMEYDGSSELHLGQKIEITEYEEDLALLLELCDHVLLVGE